MLFCIALGLMGGSARLVFGRCANRLVGLLDVDSPMDSVYWRDIDRHSCQDFTSA
jgi:hypothetical protein